MLAARRVPRPPRGEPGSGRIPCAASAYQWVESSTGQRDPARFLSMVPEPAERSQGPPGRRRFRPRLWRDYLESRRGRKQHVSGARGPGERRAPGGAQWLARGAVPPGAAVRAAAPPHILRRHSLAGGRAAAVAAFLVGLVTAPAGACLRPGRAPSSSVSGVGPRGAGWGAAGARGAEGRRNPSARRSRKASGPRLPPWVWRRLAVLCLWGFLCSLSALGVSRFAREKRGGRASGARWPARPDADRWPRRGRRCCHV